MATFVPLLTASPFAILAGSGITIAGAVNSSNITGDIGTHPTPAITGLGNAVLNGTNHADDAVTVQAKVDLIAAYLNAAGQLVTSTVPTELGGTTKLPGVYDTVAGTLGITGTLTLDAQGDPDAIFIFKAASTLITASSSVVLLINGAQACNVFWQVGSSATLGTSSEFIGNILALTSITVTTSATVLGRLLARNGAVTLDTNDVTVCSLLPGGNVLAGLLLEAQCYLEPCMSEQDRQSILLYVRSQNLLASGGEDLTGLTDLQTAGRQWQGTTRTRREALDMAITIQNALAAGATFSTDINDLKEAARCYLCVPTDRRKQLLGFLKVALDDLGVVI